MKCYIYTDASIKVSADEKKNKYSYIGGIITDENAKIVFTFFDKIYSSEGFNYSHIDYSEACAIDVGISYACEMGFIEIVCVTDSKNCVQAIENFRLNSKDDANKLIKKMSNRLPPKIKENYIEKLHDILYIAKEFFVNFEIKHVLRKNNQYADHMSKYLNIMEHESKSKRKKFKEMLNTVLLNGCEYDFILERKEHIADTLRNINLEKNEHITTTKNQKILKFK